MLDVSDAHTDPSNVLNCTAQRQTQLTALLKPYGIVIEHVPDDQPIPGSFFGEREAGIIGNRLLLRYDTPVHSALHEAGHQAVARAVQPIAKLAGLSAADPGPPARTVKLMSL